jgi:hypothetical protein
MAPASTSSLNPVAVLVTLCEDAFFAITGSGRLDLDNLRALAARRATALRAAALGLPPEGIDAWDGWQKRLCSAMAPIAPPRWMPMADAIEAGLSLEHGARGMRALFTTKPSEKEVTRVRVVGAFASRALGAVLSATGTFSPEARLLRGTLVASLGLPPEDQQLLDADAPVAAEALDISGGMDAKIAKAIVRGSYFAAMGDGMDPRKEQAVMEIANKVGLTTEDINALRAEARALVDAAKPFGEACVEAIRYLLEGDLAESERLAAAAVRLTLPPIHRRDAITALNVGGPVTLGHKHALDRRRREAVLALAWVSAMLKNPSYALRAQIAARHNRVAADLGDESDAGTIRASIDRHIETELIATLEAAATA